MESWLENRLMGKIQRRQSRRAVNLEFVDACKGWRTD